MVLFDAMQDNKMKAQKNVTCVQFEFQKVFVCDTSVLSLNLPRTFLECGCKSEYSGKAMPDLR